jgi:uncharacterized pyridoxamine 5'-phosphate oxidase family protein
MQVKIYMLLLKKKLYLCKKSDKRYFKHVKNRINDILST